MSLTAVLLALAVVAALYALAVLALVLAGRRGEAAALARFVPDCAVLLRRLLADGRLPRRHKALVGALLAYLVVPIDLVPDMIPVAGQLDDAILIAVVLRVVLGRAGEGLLREHWPGPERSLQVVRRLSFGRA